MKKEKIDFYGTDANYIHLKFGNARKMYNFTKEFQAEYPNFCEQYQIYFDGKYASRFISAYSIIKYIEDFKIPVRLYLNFTDKEVSIKKALKWWKQNNTVHEAMDKKNK